MKQINCDVIVGIMARLQHLDGETFNKSGLLTPQDRAMVKETIGKEMNLIVGFDVESTFDQAIRIENVLDKDSAIDWQHVHQLVRSLSERYMDDVGRCHMMVLSSDESKHYRDKEPFGPKVIEAFPSAVFDAEEASKCLALGRGTGAVFHLMRVMEAGLRAVAKALGIPYAPSWEAYLKQMKPLLEADYKDKPPDWKPKEAFFRDVNAQLFAVKLAWRNPTMHLVQTYTPEVAEDIFNAVRGFMRHISTELSEVPVTDVPENSEETK